jgi:toxin ParE1/3/4
MPHLHVSSRAYLDLIEIWNYIADDSVENADTFVDQLNEVIQNLCRHPRMGRRREELAPTIRSFPYQRYIIYYRIEPDALVIVRVLHGARDVESGIERGASDWEEES